ncbi:DNA primase [Entomospira culicis]|uniref:DNA primase n=1 Tax=Entomospira culicis TaxID=2719989 RepID=A0A968KTR7_9SPIO|nr:DNA primase [Entomospira culicis]NIZ18518.1 DNA primase [Entomospira culicis]NIZ68734.1 DNA primase [Entomospira culicis]WDI37330.1 DNA primase [Entomospira culicis]WDI38959.1 DNA primase [Entomospira culicis]
MSFSKAVVAQIEERLDIVELIGSYISVQSKSGRFWACCPFHHEKTPSFSISREYRSYHCFGCGAKGGLFQFYMQMEGVDFPEAVRVLAQRVGIDLSPEREEVQREILQRKTLQELYQRLTKSFEHLLWHSARGQEALAYLYKRGLSEENIRTFRVGYGMSGYQELYQFLLKRGYSEPFLAESGLFSKKHPMYSIFRDRIIFPLINSAGEVVAYSGRAMPDAKADAPKYINSPETVLFSKRKELYGMGQAKESIRKEEQFILCEGAMDVMALHQMGYTQAVAPLGSAFTLEQAELVRRFASSALLLMDGDAAGQKAIHQSAMICEESGVSSLRAVRLPANKDPSECLEYGQVDLLTKSIKHASLYFDFLLQEQFKEIPKDNIDQQMRASLPIFKYISIVPSPVRRESYLKMLAGKLHISVDAVVAEYTRFSEESFSSVKSDMPRDFSLAPPSGGVDKEDVLEVLSASLMDAQLYKEYEEFLVMMDLSAWNLAEIYQYLVDTPTNLVNMDHLFETYSLDASIKELLEQKRLSMSDAQDSWQQRATRAWARISFQEFTHQRGRLLLDLAKSEQEKDVMLISELQVEVNRINLDLHEVWEGMHG